MGLKWHRGRCGAGAQCAWFDVLHLDQRGGVFIRRSAAGARIAQSWRGVGVHLFHIVLPQAAPGLIAASIFVFLESLDEFTATFFVGAPDITTLPILLYTASMSGNYEVSSITALILLGAISALYADYSKIYATGNVVKAGEIGGYGRASGVVKVC